MQQDHLTRRKALLLGGAATPAAPAILRAQLRELVVGGAASHKPWVEAHVQPYFEKKYGARLTFGGTRSLVNLEKMQKTATPVFVGRADG